MNTGATRPLRCPICGALDTLSLEPTSQITRPVALRLWTCVNCGSEAGPVSPAILAAIGCHGEWKGAGR